MNAYSYGWACLLLLAGFAASPALAQTQVTQPPAAAAPRISPCPAKAEYKQFDFWTGEWDVTEKEEKIAVSRIERIVNSCIIFENYTQGDGYTGKSFNFYDATLGKWRQTWVDGFGNVSEFVGEYKDNAMRFEGESHLSDGRKVLRRMTLFNLGPDRVRQYSERSTDGGKTWSVNYDFVYRRKK